MKKLRHVDCQIGRYSKSDLLRPNISCMLIIYVFIDALFRRFRASWLTQFYAITWRAWLSVLKEPMLIRVRLSQTIVSLKVVMVINLRSFYE
jgi:hypothetical protein